MVIVVFLIYFLVINPSSLITTLIFAGIFSSLGAFVGTGTGIGGVFTPKGKTTKGTLVFGIVGGVIGFLIGGYF